MEEALFTGKNLKHYTECLISNITDCSCYHGDVRTTGQIGIASGRTTGNGTKECRA